MYRKEIEEYIDSHKDQMIEDICTLCRINSEKMPYTEGKPFGEGPFEVLQTALTMMENYDYAVVNDKVDLAVKRIERIIESEHLRVPRVIDRYKGMLASADLAR